MKERRKRKGKRDGEEEREGGGLEKKWKTDFSPLFQRRNVAHARKCLASRLPADPGGVPIS